MAAAQVGRRFAGLGGRPVLRAGVVTDNGGHILDVARPGDRRSGGDGGRGQPVAGRRLRAASSLATGRLCLLGTAEGVRTMRF